MAIDWDRLVVESEHNGVIASAGEVALLVGADAAGVTWGNITGDVTQQADLMALVDGYAPVNSPQFTGTPRTVTPPAGNNSTRIASTAFVQGAIDSLGALAKKNTVDYATDVTNKPNFGSLAFKSSITEDDIRHTEYLFVDGENGSDISGTGSLDNPFLSIAKAVQEASDIYLTIIEVYASQYDYSGFTINNKRIMLYSLAGSNTAIDIGRIYVNSGFLEMYGFMTVWGVDSSHGSKVFYYPAEGGYHLGLKGALKASYGGEITIPEISVDSNLSCLLDAKSGGIITVNCISREDLHPIHADVVAFADGGIIQYVTFAPAGNISFTTFKSEANNGKVTQIFPDTPKTSGTKNYLMSSQDSWVEAGSMARSSDVPDNDSPYSKWYVRTSLKEGNAYVHRWEDMDPPMNTNTNTKKVWVRTHEYSAYPQSGAWEELEEPPDSSSTTPKLYARTSYMVGTPPDHFFKHGWAELGGMAADADPPINSSTTLKKKYWRTNELATGAQWEEVDEAPINTTTKEKWYARTSVTRNSKRVFDWAELGSMAFETAKLEEVFVDSSNGSDSNDGTSGSKAVRTIGKALELATSTAHCTIFAAAGSYNEDEIQIEGKNVTFECLTSGGTIEISNSVNRTDSFGLYITASKVVFNCKVDISTVKGTGVYVDYGSTFVAGGLSVHTPNTCILVENASTAFVSTLTVYSPSQLVADSQKGSTMSISYVWGDYGTNVTKVFNATGGIIMYGSISTSGAHALNYTTLSTATQGGLVRG